LLLMSQPPLMPQPAKCYLMPQPQPGLWLLLMSQPQPQPGLWLLLMSQPAKCYLMPQPQPGLWLLLMPQRSFTYSLIR
jgi:hypothetical protein